MARTKWVLHSIKTAGYAQNGCYILLSLVANRLKTGMGTRRVRQQKNVATILSIPSNFYPMQNSLWARSCSQAPVVSNTQFVRSGKPRKLPLSPFFFFFIFSWGGLFLSGGTSRRTFLSSKCSKSLPVPVPLSPLVSPSASWIGWLHPNPKAPPEPDFVLLIEGSEFASHGKSKVILLTWQCIHRIKTTFQCKSTLN